MRVPWSDSSLVRTHDARGCAIRGIAWGGRSQYQYNVYIMILHIHYSDLAAGARTECSEIFCTSHLWLLP